MNSSLRDERPLPFFIFFLLVLVSIFSVVNAQENVTDICEGITAQICTQCVPKSLLRFLNPSELLSTIIGKILGMTGLMLPEISISLISILVIVMTIWALAKKIDTVLLIVVVLLIIMIVVTAILHYVSPTTIPI